jgi:CHASE3 domain sensor protein
MKTFKKILKYISLSIGLLIFLWFAYGLYLYLNLPGIKIENNDLKTTFSSRADKSYLPTNIDAEFVVKSLLPSDKLFKFL